jgi:hypothetical protein
MKPVRLALALSLLFAASCSIPSATSSASLVDDLPGLDMAALAGTYTGVLQETGGARKYYLSLDQTVTVSQASPLELSFSSSVFPTFSASVLSTGQSAVNLDLVGEIGGDLDVQEVAFAKDSMGHWVLVIQMATVGDGASAGVVQYGSYDPASAPPASASAAVSYLDSVFALASKAGG